MCRQRSARHRARRRRVTFGLAKGDYSGPVLANRRINLSLTICFARVGLVAFLRFAAWRVQCARVKHAGLQRRAWDCFCPGRRLGLTSVGGR